MSSITTAVPTGILPGWCLADAWGFDGQPYECGNGTLYAPSDFWTVCCDGDIVNVKENIWTGPNMTMDDLTCCRHIGKLQGGLHPLPTGPPWRCDLDAVGTPLASLAATNTDNAGAFVATYASANYEHGSPPTDMLWTETPQCLWVNTKMSHAMSQVTVAAPTITSLSTTRFLGGDNDGDVETAQTVTTPISQVTSSAATTLPTDMSDVESSITRAPLMSSSTTGEGTFQSTSSSGSAGSSVTGTPFYTILLPLFTFVLVGGPLW